MITYEDDKKLKGIETFENGDVYQGAFKDGKKHGKGILRTRNDRSYEGEWKYDKPHGFGINTFPNGKIYTGNFENGKPVGEGQWTYADGRIYNGTWIKGAFVNNEDKIATQGYRLVTFFINMVVIGGMLSFVLYWVLSFLKIM